MADQNQADQKQEKPENKGIPSILFREVLILFGDLWKHQDSIILL